MFSLVEGVSWMNYFLVGFTLLPLTHTRREAARHADTVLQLRDGRIESTPVPEA